MQFGTADGSTDRNGDQYTGAANRHFDANAVQHADESTDCDVDQHASAVEHADLDRDGGG
ncbi:MAG: hypothetical protein WCJ70_04965 [bacterium]